MRRPRPNVAALLVALFAAIASAATKEPIEERLKNEQRKLARLQAGNCCRRLGEPRRRHRALRPPSWPSPADHPWCTGHVAWAVKTAQWEKRWARLELKAAPSGADSTGD